MRAHVALIVLDRDKKWLVQRSGLPWKTIDALLSDETVWPTRRTLRKVARALGVSPQWLTTNAPRSRLTMEERQSLKRRIDGLEYRGGRVRRTTAMVTRAGKPNVRREARRRVPGYMRQTGARDVYRVLRESMSDFGLDDGDVLYVKPISEWNARSNVGNFVIVERNGSLFVRQLLVGPEGIVLLCKGDRGHRRVMPAGEDWKPRGLVVASSEGCF